MRRILLIAALVVLGTAGVAYGATVVTNVYVVSGHGKPLTSGTKAHPKPAGATITYTVSTIPKGQRPNTIKVLVVTIAGVRVHTNSFPTCSTSTLNDTSKGPKACPTGSLVGTGYFIADIGSAKDTKVLVTCRAELSVFNGGGNSLSYYVYLNPAQTGAVKECPSTTPPTLPLAFAAHLKESGTTLVQTLKVPTPVLHPGNNTALDAAVIKSSVTIRVISKKIKGKTVGFAETTLCPANHKRHVSVKFTLESGKSQTATANLGCK
jgi:hypothetical protein